MNIFDFKKGYMESLEFYYFLHELHISLYLKHNTSKNSLIQKFINILHGYGTLEAERVADYNQLIQDYSFWNSRYFYQQNLQKFITGELSVVAFVDQVLEQILTDRAEGLSLMKDFQKQARIDFDPKSFKFSEIFWGLRLTLEGFEEDPDPEDEINSTYFTEEKIREGMKLALIDVENYFKD